MRHVTRPTRIPVPGGKLIEEIFGRVNTGTSDFSIAHMIAPPGWGEPAQRPEFVEVTIVLRGTMRVELEGRSVDVRAGESIRVEPNERVRYSNPFEAEAEYYALCVPAFSVELAHREE